MTLVSAAAKKYSERLRSKNHIQFLYLLPLLLVLIGLFVIPVGRVLFLAFQQDGNLTLANFQLVLSSSGYIDVIVRTLRISFITTLVTLISGYILSYYIVFKSAHTQLFLLIVFITMTVDLVVRIFGFVIAFSNDGIVESILSPFLGDFSILFTETAIIIGLVQFALPFMIFVLVGVLSNIDTDLMEAARDLGASRFQIFLRLTLPLSKNGITVGSSLVFALCMSSFVSPQLLGGGGNRMLANTIYSVIFETGDWGIASALGILLLLITMGIIVILTRGVNQFVGVINR